MSNKQYKFKELVLAFFEGGNKILMSGFEMKACF